MCMLLNVVSLVYHVLTQSQIEMTRKLSINVWSSLAFAMAPFITFYDGLEGSEIIVITKNHPSIGLTAVGQVFDIGLCILLDSPFLEALSNKLRIVLAVFALG